MAQVKITNLTKQDFPLTVHGDDGMETVLIKGKSSRVFSSEQLPPDVDTKVALKQIKKEVIG